MSQQLDSLSHAKQKRTSRLFVIVIGFIFVHHKSAIKQDANASFLTSQVVSDPVPVCYRPKIVKYKMPV